MEFVVALIFKTILLMVVDMLRWHCLLVIPNFDLYRCTYLSGFSAGHHNKNNVIFTAGAKSYMHFVGKWCHIYRNSLPTNDFWRHCHIWGLRSYYCVESFSRLIYGPPHSPISRVSLSSTVGPKWSSVVSTVS